MRAIADRQQAMRDVLLEWKSFADFCIERNVSFSLWGALKFEKALDLTNELLAPEEINVPSPEENCQP